MPGIYCFVFSICCNSFSKQNVRYLRTYCEASPLNPPAPPPIPGAPNPGVILHGMEPIDAIIPSLHLAAQTPTKTATKNNFCK